MTSTGAMQQGIAVTKGRIKKKDLKFAQLRATVASLVAASLANSVFSAEQDGPAFGKQKNGYVDVSGSKIYYEEAGVGPAIVFLHDGLLDAVTWDEIWQPLASKCRVIRYDRRGYGRSEPPLNSYSSTEDLRKLLAHLNVRDAVVVGSSSGGASAIDFAIAHPEMVNGLFLIGPVVNGMSYTNSFLERANRNNEPMQRDDARAMARNWSRDRFLIAGSNETARQKVFEQLVENAEKLKKFDSALEEKLSPPASGRLAEIKAPTLILLGEGDIADVKAHCDAIHAGVRGSELFVVKNAGHLIQMEKPAEIVKRLQDFAARCWTIRGGKK